MGGKTLMARIVVFATEDGTRYVCKRGMHMSPEFKWMCEAIHYALSQGWAVEGI
jgi:hypothetical protein